MGKVIIAGAGGSGAGSDECTASKAEVLKGYKAITSDSADEVAEGTLELTGDVSDSQVLEGKTYYNSNPKIKRTGSMVNHGAVALSLNAGASYTVPAGFHNGGGKVTANSLASQTSATATAAQILNGQTAWVNGGKITGNIASLAGQTINPTASQQTVSSSGKYMTGNVVVNGVSNLSAGNIKRGVVVGGVTGTWEGYVGGANDLYIRGANKAGFVGESYISFETAQITINSGAGGGGRVMAAQNVRFAGYSYLNIEGNFSGGYIQLTPGNLSYMQVNVSGMGTWSFNLSTAQITGQCRIFFYNGGSTCYRIWLS